MSEANWVVKNRKKIYPERQLVKKKKQAKTKQKMLIPQQCHPDQEEKIKKKKTTKNGHDFTVNITNRKIKNYFIS